MAETPFQKIQRQMREAEEASLRKAGLAPAKPKPLDVNDPLGMKVKQAEKRNQDITKAFKGDKEAGKRVIYNPATASPEEKRRQAAANKARTQKASRGLVDAMQMLEAQIRVPEGQGREIAKYSLQRMIEQEGMDAETAVNEFLARGPFKRTVAQGIAEKNPIPEWAGNLTALGAEAGARYAGGDPNDPEIQRIIQEGRQAGKADPALNLLLDIGSFGVVSAPYNIGVAVSPDAGGLERAGGALSLLDLIPLVGAVGKFVKVSKKADDIIRMANRMAEAGVSPSKINVMLEASLDEADKAILREQGQFIQNPQMMRGTNQAVTPEQPLQPQPRMTREQIRAEAQKARASVPERRPFTPAEAQGYDPGQAPDLRAGLTPKPEVAQPTTLTTRNGAKVDVEFTRQGTVEGTKGPIPASFFDYKGNKDLALVYVPDTPPRNWYVLDTVNKRVVATGESDAGAVIYAQMELDAPTPEPTLNPADPLGMREAPKVDDQWKTKSPVDYTDSDLASMKQAIERGMKPGAVKTSDMSASQRTQYPWHEETFSQFQSREENITRPTESVRDTHRFLVQQALSEGKPVPAEVLADYPDLMPKVEAPKPESVATPEQPQGKRRTFMLGGQEGARNYGTFETADLESLYQYATQLRGRGTGKAGRGKVGAGRTAAEQQAEASRLRPQMVERFGENVDDLARKVYDDVRAQAKEAGEDAEFVIRNRVQFGDQPAPTTTRAKIKQAEPKPESVATPEQPAKKTDKATQAKAQKTLQQAVPSGEFEGTRMERMAWAKEQGIEYRKIQVESEKAMSDARKMAESNNPRTYSEGMRILREPIMETQYVAYSADGEPLFKVTKTEFDLYDGAKAEGKPAKSPAPATNRLEEAKNARDRFYDELSKQPTPEGFKGTRSDWLGYEEREFALREFPDLYTRDEVGNVVRKPQPTPTTTRAKIKQAANEARARIDEAASGGEMGAASGFNVQYLKDYATIVADELLDGLEVTIEGFRKRFGNIEQADFDRLMQDARAMADELQPETVVNPASQPEAVVRPVETPKEPWQMTREEFKKARGSKSGSAKTIVREIAPNKWVVRAMQGNEEVGKATFVKTSKGIRLEPASMIYVEPSARRQGIGSSIYEAIESHTGLSLTPAGTRTGDGNAIWNNPNRTFGHRDYIDEAIAEGKPVPAEVLADYPDLRPVKTPKPAAPVQSAPKPEPAPTGQTGAITLARQGNVADAKAQVKTPETFAKEAGERYQQTGGKSGRDAVAKVEAGKAVNEEEAADVLAWTRDLANRYDAGEDVYDDLVRAENARVSIRGQWSNVGRAMQGTLDELYQPGRVGARIERIAKESGLSAKETAKLKEDAEAFAKLHKESQAEVARLSNEVEKLRAQLKDYNPSPEKVQTAERKNRIQSAQKAVISSMLKKLGKMTMGIDTEVWGDVSRLVRLEFQKGGVTWREASVNVQKMLKGEELEFDLDDIVDVSSGYAQSLEPKKAMNAEAERLYLARREEFLRSKLRDFGEVEAPAKPKMPTNVQIETLQGALKKLRDATRTRKPSKSEAQRIAELEDRIQKAKAGNVEQPRPRRLQSEEEKRLRRELNQLQARLRMSDEEWNTRNLAKVQKEIEGLEEQLKSGNLQARETRKAFREASENLLNARKKRNALRRQIDARIKQANDPKTFITKLKTWRRESQLANPLSAARDVLANVSSMAVSSAVTPIDSGLAKLIGKLGKGDPLHGALAYNPWRTAYVLKDAGPRWRQEMRDALKGVDDVSGLKYENTGVISRARGALDTPFRDTYQRTFAYDFAASKFDEGTSQFDQAYRQILDPEANGPLSAKEAQQMHEQTVQWANFNTYNNDNVLSKFIEGMRKGGRQKVLEYLGTTPGGKQSLRAVADALDFFFDELTRYSKVISNVAADTATYADPFFAVGRATALGISDYKKYGNLPPQTAKAMAQMIRKGALGMGVVGLGRMMYEMGVKPEAITPILVQTQNFNEETGKTERGSTKFVDEGQMGGIGGIFAPLTMGYAQALLDDALSKGLLTPGPNGQYEKLKAKWVKPWTMLLDQPAVSGPQRFFRDLERSEGKDWGETLGAGFASVGAFNEWARLQDRIQTGIVRRDTKQTPGGKVIERLPVARQTLPSGQAGRFPGNPEGMSKAKDKSKPKSKEETWAETLAERERRARER